MPPKIHGFRPANGSLHASGEDLDITILFSKGAHWCDTNYSRGDDVTFWCLNAEQAYKISRSSVKFAANVMRISLSPYQYGMRLQPARTCSLAIASDRICDSSGVAFGGIMHGSYSLQLLDEQQPVLQEIVPHSDAVMPLDAWITLKWSEAVQWNPRELNATVHEFKIRADGHTVRFQSATIPLRAPYAEIVSGRILRLHLRGKLTPGGVHSLQLPDGAVRDVSGNPSMAIPPQAYRFRAAALNQSAGAASNANAVHSAAYNGNTLNSALSSTSEGPQTVQTSLGQQKIQTMASKTPLPTSMFFLPDALVLLCILAHFAHEG